jgi:uncharacterized protein (DUF1800 family)
MSRRYVVIALIVSTFSCADDESSQRREEEWIREPELGAAAATALGTGENQSGPVAPAVTTSAQAIRFLEQATFGPKPNRIAHVVDIGITAAIDEELNRAAGEFAPTPPHVPPTPCDDPFPANLDLDAQFFVAAINGPDQLRLRTMFALSQILVVSASGINELKSTCNSEKRDAMQRYFNVLRAGAFGSYRTLLEKIALEPAMGNYLDMVNNVAFDRTGKQLDPNENFAREMMQLFTVGTSKLDDSGQVVLVDGKSQPVYTAADVESFARTLTGWTYPSPTGCPGQGGTNKASYSGPMIGCSINHDSTSATLLTYRGSVSSTTAGGSPRTHLTEAIDNLFNHPNLPPFVCKQLIHHLVTSNPSRAYVTRIVNVFKNDGTGKRGNLKAVIRAILLDAEARTPTSLVNYGRLRAPVEFITRVVRALNGVLDDSGQDPGGALNEFSKKMGQDVSRPASVFSYYQAETKLVGPEFAILDTYTVTRRADFLHQLLFTTSLSNKGVSVTLEMGVSTTNLVNWIDKNLLHETMSTALRATLTNALDNIILVGNDADKRALAIYLASLAPEFQVQR